MELMEGKTFQKIVSEKFFTNDQNIILQGLKIMFSIEIEDSILKELLNEKFFFDKTYTLNDQGIPINFKMRPTELSMSDSFDVFGKIYYFNALDSPVCDSKEEPEITNVKRYFSIVSVETYQSKIISNSGFLIHQDILLNNLIQEPLGFSEHCYLTAKVNNVHHKVHSIFKLKDSYCFLTDYGYIEIPRSKRYVYIFDFDLTLSVIHMYNEYINDYKHGFSNFKQWISQKNPPIIDVKYVNYIFEKLRFNGCYIYIASFGIKELIEYVLYHYDLLHYVDDIITPESFANTIRNSCISVNLGDLHNIPIRFCSDREIYTKYELVKYIQLINNKGSKYIFLDDSLRNIQETRQYLPNVTSVYVKYPIIDGIFQYDSYPFEKFPF